VLVNPVRNLEIKNLEGKYEELSLSLQFLLSLPQLLLEQLLVKERF
jgi:hypothetical protein